MDFLWKCVNIFSPAQSRSTLTDPFFWILEEVKTGKWCVVIKGKHFSQLNDFILIQKKKTFSTFEMSLISFKDFVTVIKQIC